MSAPLARPQQVAKSGLTRAGSGVCGVLGFHQHLGLIGAVLGGVGWIVAADHAGWFVQRRFGQRLAAGLRARCSGSLPRRWVIARAQAFIGVARYDAPYRTYAAINTVGAVAWGGLFVGAGYLLACVVQRGRLDWASPALMLTAGAAFGCALFAVGLAVASRAGRAPAYSRP